MSQSLILYLLHRINSRQQTGSQCCRGVTGAKAATGVTQETPPTQSETVSRVFYSKQSMILDSFNLTNSNARRGAWCGCWIYGAVNKITDGLALT